MDSIFNNVELTKTKNAKKPVEMPENVTKFLEAALEAGHRITYKGLALILAEEGEFNYTGNGRVPKLSDRLNKVPTELHAAVCRSGGDYGSEVKEVAVPAALEAGYDVTEFGPPITPESAVQAFKAFKSTC